ncbi:MAG TPA: T9SS type A sorting domain-containing protein, partial [Saprospiraceae bacterium]|nr:T9SS type A sorting domain-containing protein [Saprospiraceae bacterium]
TIGLNLLFKQESTVSTLDVPFLYQNEPNPFENYTALRFNLVEDQEAIISIIDLDGKIINETKSAYLKGEHTLNLDKNIFPTTGVYYYQLKTASFTNVKKMMYIN